MRIESFRLAGKFARHCFDFGGIALKGAITAGFVAIAVSTVYEGTLVPQDGTSPIEQFLLENDGEQKVVPQKTKKPQVKKIKTINLQVSNECNQYFKLVHKHFGKESTLRTAQMHKESSCNARAVGEVDEIGLFQVKRSTCADMGVTGDLFDPETNIRCAAAYSRWLCEVKGHCEVVPNLVAYNAGGDGVKRVRNLAMHPYAQGIFQILGLRA